MAAMKKNTLNKQPLSKLSVLLFILPNNAKTID